MKAEIAKKGLISCGWFYQWFRLGLVCTGVTPGPEVNVSGTRGSYFSTGLTGTDSGFGNDFAFGGSDGLPALIYLNLFYN